MKSESVADLLLENLPRNLILAVEEALLAGAGRAFQAARGMAEGHLPHVVGQLRHFHMNESFHKTLFIAGLDPSPIKGNGIVSATAGIFRVSRFNIPRGFWVNGRRSVTRRHMSWVNRALEPLVQTDMFQGYAPPSEATAFFVGCFSGTPADDPSKNASIQLAVPNRDMTGWLFREPLEEFLGRYDAADITQPDGAHPALKKNISRMQD